MEFKGTKEDWIISPESIGFIADKTDSFAIAKVFRNTGISDIEFESNLRLISCAPEMLEMLQHIEKTYDRGTDTYNALVLLIEKATTLKFML